MVINVIRQSIFFIICSFVMSFGVYLLITSNVNFIIQAAGFNYYSNHEINNYGSYSTIGMFLILMSFTFMTVSYIKMYDEIYNLSYIALVLGISIVISVGVYSVYHLEDNKEIIIEQLQKYNDKLIKKNENFLNSDVGKQFNNALNTKNYEQLKLLVSDTNNLVGLTDDQVFEKLMIVENSSNKEIKEAFNKIYNDKYITINEYNKFKQESIDIATKNIGGTGSDDNHKKENEIINNF